MRMTVVAWCGTPRDTRPRVAPGGDAVRHRSHMTRTIAIAGGTGALGRRVVVRALEAGWRVKLLTRDEARVPEALRARVTPVVGDGRDAAVARTLVEGVDAIFSCAGASVALGFGHGWRGYRAVDPAINRALIDAAAAGGKPRFVYVSVFHTPAMRGLAYVDAHERVVAMLAQAGLPHAVIRPTGFFSAIVPTYLDLARKGAVPEIGDGTARTNPIADDDLAAVCMEAIASAGAAEAIDVGGPEVVTRRGIVDLAAAALGRTAKVRRVPPWLARAGSAGFRLVHPRMGQFARFIVAISTLDLIAPAHGHARLGPAFAAAVRAGR